MATASKTMVIFLVFAAMKLGMCAVYRVGDSTGWTIIGSPNYTAWASRHTFHVGDRLLFSYNSQFHNVLTVTRPNYDACNATAPLETRTTGNDSIPLTRTGHHYYICGIPGHCANFSQKVDINVVQQSLSMAPSSTPSPSLIPPPLSKAPSPLVSPSPSSTPGSSSSAPAGSPGSSPPPAAGASKAPYIRPSFSGFGKVGLALAVVAVYSVSAF